MAAKKTVPAKTVSKKNVKSTSGKINSKGLTKKEATKSAKKPVLKSVAKAPGKPAAKKTVAKPVAKPVAKKAAAKPAVKASVKPVAKPVAKNAAPKPFARRVVPKKPTRKATVKAVVKPAPKPVAKVAPARKPELKKPAKAAEQVKKSKTPVKPLAKKVVKPVVKKEIKKEKIKEPKAPKAPKSGKKHPPTKTLISSSNNMMPKRSDVFKTNTFAAPNLKNDTGKIIAHRKTSELKRKNEDEIMIKKYEPEQRRSLLDKTHDDSKTSYRYSDEDLQEFREIVMRKLETAKTELQYLQGVIMRKDEGGTEDTENKYQSIEDGSASMDREQFTQLASRQISFITHLEQALVRIENKTYGICRETGKLIDKARLRAVPHATLSIEAKNAKKN